MITEISGFCFLKFLNVRTKHFDVNIEAVLTINCSIHTRVVHQLFGLGVKTKIQG